MMPNAEFILYVDRSDVGEGKLDELRTALPALARFIEANVPRILFYHVFFSEDEKQMIIAHMHPDSASLERHMEVGGPVFRRFTELLRLRSIELYGSPTDRAVEQAREKARMLGGGTVSVHQAQAGFARLAS